MSLATVRYRRTEAAPAVSAPPRRVKWQIPALWFGLGWIPAAVWGRLVWFVVRAIPGSGDNASLLAGFCGTAAGILAYAGVMFGLSAWYLLLDGNTW